MNEVIVRYKNRKVLKALTALGEYLGFTVDEPKKDQQSRTYLINGVPVESGDPSIDMHALHTIFTGTDIDAKTLRESAWRRKE